VASHLALPLILLVILLLTLLVSRRRRTPPLRSIAALETLPGQTAQAVESGQKLHLSLGTGGVGGRTTMASLAGLYALAHLAEQGVAAGTPPLVSVSDPTLLPLAQNVLLRAFEKHGRRRDFNWTQVRVVSPTAIGYALGTLDMLGHEPVLANVMLGAFGPEVAFISHAANEANLAQIGGTDDPQALSVLWAMTDGVVIGEELYATDTYLDRTMPKVMGLVAQDIARVILVVFIILFALFRIAGAT